MRFSSSRKRLKVEALKQFAKVSDSDFVLDLGGGETPCSYNTTNVDLVKGVDFDLFETSEKFDVVVLADSLYYSKNPLALLKKCRGWLKPNGKIVVSVFASEWYNRVVLSLMSSVLYLWDEQTLNTLLVEAGFSNARFTRFATPWLTLPLFIDCKWRFGKGLFAVAECGC